MLMEAAETREDLTYEQKIALEHAHRFSRIDQKTAEALIKDLMAAYPMEEKFAVQIADLLPQHPEDVQAMLQKARLDLSDDDLEDILDIVDKHYVA
jgi:DNA-directed RNA polymerase subunit F